MMDFKNVLRYGVLSLLSLCTHGVWAKFTQTKIVHRDGAIPVFLACDNNYVQPCATAIASVSKNSKRVFDFYILDCGISEGNIQKINNWGLGKDKISIVKIDEVSDFMGRNEYYPAPVFYRLLIPEIFPDMNKGIYMDCDMICVGDLGKAWDMDITGKYLGVVQDFCKHTELKQTLGIPPGNFYFNSGFLLMNLAMLREFRYTEKSIQFLREHSILNFPDQDCLNVLFPDQSKILELGNRFNSVQKGMGDPIVIHFTLRKPWKLPKNFIRFFPFRFREWYIEYYRYLALTPFADEAKTNGSWKIAFSDAIWKTLEQPIENFIREVKAYFKTLGQPK